MATSMFTSVVAIKIATTLLLNNGAVWVARDNKAVQHVPMECRPQFAISASLSFGSVVATSVATIEVATPPLIH